jgi:ubiquinone/menaquinone biosynthesis C-methylase UbiE
MTEEERSTQETFFSEGIVDVYSRYFLKDVERRLVEKYFNKDDLLLDIGCGAGRTTVVLHEMGYKVIGGDISKPMIERASERFPQIDFRILDACNMEFADASLSQVLFSFGGIDCVHPIEKRNQALNEIKRVLKPGGIFIYSSHNPWWLPPSLKGWKKILYNFISLRAFTSYRVEFTPYGKLYVFYKNPSAQKKSLLRKHGFSEVVIEGIRHSKGLRLLFFEQNIHFVCVK